MIALTFIPAANVIVGWVRARNVQKREVSFSDTYATAGELRRVERDLNERIVGLDRDLKALKDSISENGEQRRIAIESKVEAARSEARKAAEKLDEKVNSVARDVSKLQNASESTNQKITLMDAKLDRLIERSNHL